MIGTNNIKVILERKADFFEKSLKFARYEAPDFMLMREAIMVFEKVAVHEIKQ